MSYRKGAMKDAMEGIMAALLAAGFATTTEAQFKKDLPPITCEALESIGTAEMSADGTITLRLRSLSPNPIAEGVLTYAPDDPQYEDIKQHLGGIAPGDIKPVKPWC
jgi:hypothetical protein